MIAYISYFLFNLWYKVNFAVFFAGEGVDGLGQALYYAGQEIIKVLVNYCILLFTYKCICN